MPNPAVGMWDYEEGAHLQTISPLQPLSKDLPGQPLPAVLIPSLKLQGDPKKMVHSVLTLKSVVEVGFYFSTGVSEWEFRAQSN